MLLLLLAACQSEQSTVPVRTLALTDPLPAAPAASTRLRIGDPKVQKQLALSGLGAQLPFDVDWQNITGGPLTIEAFRASALDAGSVGDTPPIHAAFTGLDIKIVAVQVRDTPSMQLAIAPGSRVQSLEELRGKKIAYSPGQAQGALVLRVLAKAQLTAADVTLVELSSTEFRDALAARQVDVAPLSGPSLMRYLRDFGPRGASAIAHGTRDSMSFLYVRTAVLQDADKAAALFAYVRLRTRAQRWASDNIERWQKAYYEEDQAMSEEDARAIIDIDRQLRFPTDWSESIALTQQTVDLIARASGRDSFDARRLFDLRFQSAAEESSTAIRTPLSAASPNELARAEASGASR